MLKNTDREENTRVSDNEKDIGFKRLKRKNSKKLLRRRIMYVLLLVLLLAVFLIIAVAVFFRVSQITVEGDTLGNEPYIIESSEISDGMNLYAVSEKEVAANIISEYPYVRSVTIHREIPNRVRIELRCDSPDFYIEIAERYFILSGEFRVLKKFESKSELEAEYPDAVEIIAGEIKSAVVGSELVFADDAYKDTGIELLSVVKNAEMFSGVTQIDYSDRFNVYITYDGRLRTNVGNTDDLALKLRFLNEIVTDLGDSKGSIDLKNVEAAYVLLGSMT